MKRTLMRTMLVVGLVVVMCGFSMQASAASFDFSQSTGFSVTGETLVSTNYYNPGYDVTPYNDIKWYQDTTGTSPLGLLDPLVPTPPNFTYVAPSAGYYNTLGWGYGNDAAGLMGSDPFGAAYNTGNYRTDYSGLKVLGMTGVVSTGVDSSIWGDWETITALYHQNNTLWADVSTLSSAIIYSEFTLDWVTDPNSVGVQFTETLNVGGVPKDDYFTFNYGTFDSIYVPLFDGTGWGLYEVGFQLIPGLNSQFVLNNASATVWTKENDTSSAYVQMRLRQVPEPATLALLGLGLLGIGLAARLRKS